MSETIVKIEEYSGDCPDGRDYGYYEGYKIETTAQTIYFLINGMQNCCESWGYFISQDEEKDFINSELKSITITDTSFKQTEFNEESLDCGDCMFVNIETDKGTFQLTAYNMHNGYYGHDAHIISTQCNFSTVL